MCAGDHALSFSNVGESVFEFIDVKREKGKKKKKTKEENKKQNKEQF